MKKLNPKEWLKKNGRYTIFQNAEEYNPTVKDMLDYAAYCEQFKVQYNAPVLKLQQNLPTVHPQSDMFFSLKKIFFNREYIFDIKVDVQSVVTGYVSHQKNTIHSFTNSDIHTLNLHILESENKAMQHAYIEFHKSQPTAIIVIEQYGYESIQNT